MEAISGWILPSSINSSILLRRNIINNKISGIAAPELSVNQKNVSLGINRSHVIPWAKKSQYEDVQAFAEPSRLLPVSDSKFCLDQKLEEMVSSSNWGAPYFYIVQLRTSSEFGSDLRDINAAILLCLIDANGNSVLQRISAASTDCEHVKEMPASEQVHFQRCSVDTITFSGPEIGNVEALWIGLESGSWRLRGVRLIIISRNQYQDLDESLMEIQDNGLQYDFEVNDMLLGEGGETSMVELRPKLATEIPITSLTSINGSLPSSVSKQGITNEQGMQEYADLKLSLLIYDSLLVSSGATILAISTSEKASLAFLVGGISGFLYLLLLQKSVDGLSASALPTANGKTENLLRALGGFKGPLSTLALLLAASAALVKYGLGDTAFSLTPQELLIGVMGFLTCKIAVVFAAFKPLGTSLKENN